MTRIPDKPSLDGIEARWMQRWDADGVYRFARTASREQVFAIDTPRRPSVVSLHMGHVFSYTHTDTVARYRRMSGKSVFYPMGWDDNGLPTERARPNYFGVRCDPSVPYQAGFTRRSGAIRPRTTSPSGVTPQLHRTLRGVGGRDEKVFEDLFRRLGLSVDWTLLYSTIEDRARAVSQKAFLRNLARGEAYTQEAPTLWDVDFKTAVAQAELEDRSVPAPTTSWPSTAPTATATSSSTPRAPSCSLCVALVAHPTTTATSRSSARRCARRCTASRCRSSPTNWPSPTRAPASR